MMKMNVIELSKYVITKCHKDGCPISNRELQFLLWRIQEEYKKEGKLAFVDNIDMTDYGPIVANAYYAFGGWGVMKMGIDYDCEIDSSNQSKIDYIVEDFRQKELWEIYCMYKEAKK